MSDVSILLALAIGVFFGSIAGKLLALWSLERKRKRALRLREALFWQRRAELFGPAYGSDPPGGGDRGDH